jgi:hypothetical protein
MQPSYAAALVVQYFFLLLQLKDKEHSTKNIIRWIGTGETMMISTTGTITGAGTIMRKDLMKVKTIVSTAEAHTGRKDPEESMDASAGTTVMTIQETMIPTANTNVAADPPMTKAGTSGSEAGKAIPTDSLTGAGILLHW